MSKDIAFLIGACLSQQIKYGKIVVKLEDAKYLGKFVLDSQVNLTYSLFSVFGFQLFKRMIRGEKVIEANVFGYAFANPIKGIINDIAYKDNSYPQPHDLKDGLLRECAKMVNDRAYEDKIPLQKDGQPLKQPSLVSTEKLMKDVLNYVTRNLVVTKTYIQPSSVRGFSGRSTRGTDLGIREAKFTFKKNDFVNFDFIGCFAIPTFHLVYKHPNSTRTFKREVLGYSGEVVRDELKCSKMPGKECDNFPDNICSVCGNLYCSEHLQQCEKCGGMLCKDCVVSKGLISKHYFCPKCAS